MKTNLKFVIEFLTLALFLIGCSPIKLTLRSLNLSKTEMIVDAESYDSKGNLKRSPSFDSKGKTDDSQNAKETQYIIDAFQGGVVKLKYKPVGSEATFNLSEIKVPKSKEDFEKAFSLSDIKTYNEDDQKQKLLEIANNLKLENTKDFYRLVDVKKLLGTVIIGKIENSVLNPKDYFNLMEEKIEYAEAKETKSSAITTKSVITNVSLTIPIYGSVQSSFSNNNLHQVMWDIKYYNFLSSFNAGSVITGSSNDKKGNLLNVLNLYPNDDIYILREFYIIESGTFSATSATKIETSADAAIASVFTADGAYAFKAEDSKFTTLPSQVYNLKFVKLMTVQNLIDKLNGNKSFNVVKEEIVTPRLIIK
jgi:hypothetical protein